MSFITTIVAEATPVGRGGIAILRISGPLVKKIATTLLGTLPPPRYAQFAIFQDDEGHAIDEGLALFFPAPHSFTGEDVLELHGHGGPVVVDALIRRIQTLGAIRARPGEFSERAFLNNKIDLTQAEAIADLIDAASEEAARAAIRSLQGEFSKRIHQLVEKITTLRMFIEAAIDFTEEEIDFLADDQIEKNIRDISLSFEEILSSAKQGSLLQEGISLVIAGEPNVGKSSLLNCLSGKDIAIVTDIPGTTRDVLRERISLEGIPLHFIDTAGLRESNDVVEQEGIKRAEREMNLADILLYMVDDARHMEINLEKLKLFAPNAAIIVVRNKCDLTNNPVGVTEQNGKTEIILSVKNNCGIDLLKDAIKKIMGFQTTEGIFSARLRHINALLKAKEHVMVAITQLQTGYFSSELLAEDLRQAQLALAEITGEFTTDDLLGRIFSTFCVGK